jgi:cysteinyl-tRNA synthetase
MKWPSPWGDGFPGWHIECTVMSTKYLGETFDLHGGGMDLKFPHHECEIAQATGANGKSPVKYWVHSNMLTVNGQKMSKSLGNSFLPSELFSGNHKLLEKGYSPMTVRFFMLQSHYSSTLDFSNEALNAAEKGFKKLNNALKIVKVTYSDRWAPENQLNSFGTQLTNDLNRLVEECFHSMSDDFNTAKAIASLFEMASRINDIKSNVGILDQIGKNTFDNFRATYIAMMEDVLGLKEDVSTDTSLLDGTINVLIGLRKKVRSDKNFALSDKIRDDLKAIGIQLKDGKDGEMSYEIES